VGAIAAVAGTAIQAVGAIREGQAAQAAANFNAQVATQNSAQAVLQAKEEERRHRIIARKQRGTQRVAAAAGGIEVTGSALDVLSESAANAELDALTIRHAGEIGALGFLNEARLSRFEGRAARTAAGFRAVGFLLQSTSKGVGESGGGGGGGGGGG